MAWGVNMSCRIGMVGMNTAPTVFNVAWWIGVVLGIKVSS